MRCCLGCRPFARPGAFSLRPAVSLSLRNWSGSGPGWMPAAGPPPHEWLNAWIAMACAMPILAGGTRHDLRAPLRGEPGPIL